MKSLLLSCTLLISLPAISAPLCAGVFKPVPTALQVQAGLVDQDLLQLAAQDRANLSLSEIQAMNEVALQGLEGLSVDRKVMNAKGQARFAGVSRELADKMIESIRQNPVTSAYSDAKYEKRQASIGFCFGRATYVDLVARRMGIQKDAIRKLWVVGPMEAWGVMWQFHVATAVRGEKGEWFVIDTVPGKLLMAREWLEQFKKQNAEGNLRFYVTNPEKFLPNPGAYSSIDFGLKLSVEQDWYSHYFVDLMKWMRAEPLSSVGLYDLRQQPQVTIKTGWLGSFMP